MTASMKTKIILLSLLMSCFLTACRTQQQTVIEKEVHDTVTVTKDSIVIHERIVNVEVPVPEIQIERVVPEDTVSVIDNGLFTSTARLEDGFLHHSLVTNKGAKIPASVQVADTTHTHGSSVSVTNTSDKQKEIIKEVNVLTTTQSFFITVGKVASGLVLLAILIFFGRFYIKKRGLLK